MAIPTAPSSDSPSLLPNADEIAALRAALRGPVVLGGEPGYDDVRAIWNGMIDRRPAVIARCLGVSDVRAALRFAREHDLPVAIRSGGHNIAGLAVADGSLMIDCSLMRGVWVDPRERTAHAQPGCQLGDVDRETQVHGLAAVLGFVSTTGIAGLTLGGGFGYLTRRFGWTCDNVRSMEVVTADGEVVRASAKENADLFWALRGGGGNFGVVTNFAYELYPVGPEIVGGAVAWHGDETRDVLAMYGDVLADAPPELTCVVALRNAPPAPWIDPAVHGEPIVAMFLCYTGKDLDRGEKLVAPIRSFGRPVGDVVQRRTYVSQQSMLDPTQPKGRRYYWKSEYLPGFSSEMIDPLVDHAQTVASPHAAILLFPLDGAVNRLPDEHSPAGNRDVGLVLNIAAGWDDPGDDAANIAWTRDTWEALRRFSTGGVYINFQPEDEGHERILSAYGANYPRLVEAKRKWDPDNVFRLNKNIPPRADLSTSTNAG